ncbi:MAG: 5'-nucleotidase C-terminal domain-containing protein [Candidatus Aegiribacteria sp.]|nr:5'-nucleotidase C-terminal domain-containing protein [Candidatus Aegiribacteria sp.]
MKMTFMVALLFTLLTLSCKTCVHDSDDSSQPVSFTLLHLNDTHSNFLSSLLKMSFPPDSEVYRLPVGSVARIAAVVDSIQGEKENVLFVHAGDMVQGSLFYTLFGGEADAAVYNAMGLDVMNLGNHEFDRGSEGLLVLLEDAEFPIVCSNLDVTDDTLLAGMIVPYTLIEVDGEQVGIIGLIVEELFNVSSPSAETEILPIAQTAQHMIEQLENDGINKIILMTHIGYENDIELASLLSGADVIVGGHTHSMLGDFSSVGLNSEGEYPTVVSGADGEDVLIVQAGTRAALLGNLTVDFDEMGHIEGYSGAPLIVTGGEIQDDDRNPVEGEALARVQELINENSLIVTAQEDPAIRELVGIYEAELMAFSHEVVGTAAEDLLHQRVPGGDLPGGSLIAPVICDAMLWKTDQLGLGADFAILNAGGARIAVPAGDITVGTVYTLMPFGNSLAALDMSGAEVVAVLEDALSNIFDDGNSDGSFPYTAGLRYTAEARQQEGERVISIEVLGPQGWAPIDPAETYRVVTVAFLARGGDGYATFSGVAALDTGFIDAEVFMDYLLEIGTLIPAESRVTFIPQN